MKSTKFPQCGDCGGEVRLLCKKGRTYNVLRRTPLRVPDDFEVPTCRKCGEESMTLAMGEKLTDILQSELRRRVCEHVEDIRSQYGATNQQIEDALRVSRTYLSHVKSGKKSPSAMLLGFLDVLATVDGAYEQAMGLKWSVRDNLAPADSPPACYHADGWFAADASETQATAKEELSSRSRYEPGGSWASKPMNDVA